MYLKSPETLEVTSLSADGTTGFLMYRYTHQRGLQTLVLTGTLEVIQSNPIILWSRTPRPREGKGHVQGHTKRSLDSCPQAPQFLCHLPCLLEAHSALVDPHPGKPGEVRTMQYCRSHPGPLREWAWVMPRPSSVTSGTSHHISRPCFASL